MLCKFELSVWLHSSVSKSSGCCGVPSECPKEISELMDECLAEKPRDRPNALKIVQSLQAMAKSQQ